MQLPAALEAHRQRIEHGLREALARVEAPARLREAMGYSLLAGGKRVRPILVLATAELFPGGGAGLMPAACALEFVHTYSLIHDDLPAMDDDDLRRGLPTCHKRYGEALAILAGDALLTEAFGLLGRAAGEPARALRAALELSQAAGAGGMVGGQVLDTLETGRALAQPEVERIHRLKTGALLTAAVRVGALLAGADEAALPRLTRYAQRLGLAFQVADDLLDVVGEAHSLGKSAGKDRAMGKTTYADLLGLESGWEYAGRLAAEAVEELAPFGARAEALRTMAAFIVRRDC
ncbi:MAG TPA: polyprenyl synthetase family protein [Myxococcota bacterium]|nr:polyprenyl synthetase family protein [Myxococcota bacterium]HRY93231.1 polyprenyl synthetase family protein [Myxococcota bacterium]HSA21040.1 polyprenyl synthetase family protein [Myxococcota bacterium]